MFQRLINSIISSIKGCEAYIDDIIIYSGTWDEHIETIQKLFDHLTEANLTINLAKSEFGCATVTYLGHIVGQGRVKPVDVKIDAIRTFPRPETRQQLMRFLGMTGYYRKFCSNFSDISEPLTQLLKKNIPFVWDEKCQKSFERVRAILESSPVLAAPNFNIPFKLAIDASDVAVGALLLQEMEDGIDHPICYFSKKLRKNPKNFPRLKECLSLVLALQHFDVYVTSTSQPVVAFSDHNPLVFLQKMKKSETTEVEFIDTGVQFRYSAH